MRNSIWLLAVSLILVSVISLSGCINPSPNVVLNDTGATQEGVNAVVNANNQFAFDLYSNLRNNSENADKNIFFSPYSISTALAMTYEGAKGQTAEEIKNVFHFPDSQTLRPNSARIYNEINKEDKEYQLSTANALWAQKDYQFLDDYFTSVEKYYGGKVTNLDFKTDTENSRVTINKWVEDQTNDKIKDLIPPGVLDPLTRLVLTNAIYFKGTWEWEFDKSNTQERDFKITPDNIVKVPMMFMKNDKAKFNYTDLGDLQILELPYKGGEISMLILLPKENLDAIEPNLTAEKLKEWKSQMTEEKLDAIYLPKFEFNTKYFMKDTLSEMGMLTAFTWPGADFSGMDGTKDLYISSVIHQAYVKLDEKGTEAAAATAVVVNLGTAALPSNIFRADHPFIFIIQEKSTGNILFLGRVTNPVAQ